MTSGEKAFGRRPAARAARLAFMAGAVYLYVWLWVDPRLIYHYQCPIFRTDGRFLAGFVGRPSGPIAYVSAFLSQRPKSSIVCSPSGHQGAA